MSSQGEVKTEPPSSEAPLPSSPSPLKAHNEHQAEKEDQANASNEPIDNTSPAKGLPPIAQPTTTTKIPGLSKFQIDLNTKRTTLESQLKSLQAEKSLLVSKSTLPSGLPFPETYTPDEKSKAAMESAQGRIKEHIASLHSYNEIKDIGLGLLGMLAEGRGVRVKDLMGEFEMGEKD